MFLLPVKDGVLRYLCRMIANINENIYQLINSADDYYRIINWYIVNYLHLSVNEACEGVGIAPTTLTVGLSKANSNNKSGGQHKKKLCKNTIYMKSHWKLLDKLCIRIWMKPEEGNAWLLQKDYFLNEQMLKLLYPMRFEDGKIQTNADKLPSKYWTELLLPTSTVQKYIEIGPAEWNEAVRRQDLPSPKLPMSGLETLLEVAKWKNVQVMMELPRQSWKTGLFRLSTALFASNMKVAVGAYATEESRRLLLEHHVMLWRLEEQQVQKKTDADGKPEIAVVLKKYTPPSPDLQFGFFFPTHNLWKNYKPTDLGERSADRCFPFGLFEVRVRSGVYDKADLLREFNYVSSSGTTCYAILDVLAYHPALRHIQLDNMFDIYKSDYVLRERSLSKFLSSHKHQHDLLVCPIHWVADNDDVLGEEDTKEPRKD